MITKPIDRISASDIQALIDNGVGESRVLEYKQALPGGSDADKREFLADASAFANASGGDLVYGVSEKKNESGQNTGLPDKIVGIGEINPDADWRRLKDILRTGIQPRIVGIQQKFVDCNDGVTVLVIRLPKSWQRPHMVTFGHLSRFFARTSAGKYQMEVSELRHAFSESGSVAERIRLFVGDRVASIAGGETRLPMPATPKMVLFVMPAGSADNTSAIDVKKIGSGVDDIVTLRGKAPILNYNAEGVIAVMGAMSPAYPCGAYTQVYRNGSIESVEATYLGYYKNGRIPILACEKQVLETIGQYCKLLSRWEVAFPYYIVLSLIGVKGMTLNLPNHPTARPLQIDKDILVTPEVVVESSEALIDKLMQQSFDIIWQACGLRECYSYKDGKWMGEALE